jgi:hypothetical protein
VCQPKPKNVVVVTVEKPMNSGGGGAKGAHTCAHTHTHNTQPYLDAPSINHKAIWGMYHRTRHCRIHYHCGIGSWGGGCRGSECLELRAVCVVAYGLSAGSQPSPGHLRSLHLPVAIRVVCHGRPAVETPEINRKHDKKVAHVMGPWGMDTHTAVRAATSTT